MMSLSCKFSVLKGGDCPSIIRTKQGGWRIKLEDDPLIKEESIELTSVGLEGSNCTCA